MLAARWKRLYSPLGPRDIRLLTLYPGRAEDPICCSLDPRTLYLSESDQIEEAKKYQAKSRWWRRGPHVKVPPQQPAYEALSYMWGLDEVYRYITVNKVKVAVRRNLWWALYHLRYAGEGKTRVLWIDGLCIDQSNIPERGAQVSIMASIYRNASRVLVWLGEQSAESNTAMQVITRFRDNRNSIRDENKKAIMSLSTRPYWTRLWVVQEICVARQLKIYCGSMSLSWEIFREFYLCESLRLWGRQRLNLARSSMMEIMERRDSYMSDGKNTLETLINSSVRFECTDPRDKVYGLLSLITDPQEAEGLPKADYSRNLPQLYLDVMGSLLTNDKPFSILKTSQALQTALFHPFWNASTRSFEQLKRRKTQDRFPVGMCSEDYIDYIGPPLYAQYSNGNYSIEWTKSIRPRLFPLIDSGFRDPRELQQVVKLHLTEEIADRRTHPRINTETEGPSALTQLEALGPFRPFKSRKARLGLALANVKLGDMLCDCMIVLRPRHDGKKYTREAVMGRALVFKREEDEDYDKYIFGMEVRIGSLSCRKLILRC
jgi:hypothetical protein